MRKPFGAPDITRNEEDGVVDHVLELLDESRRQRDPRRARHAQRRELHRRCLEQTKWTPSNAATDAAGNACQNTAVNEAVSGTRSSKERAVLLRS
jgi:hypothetical protein